MCGRLESSRRVGSRRLGGPILLKDVLPAVLGELHEVYVTRGGLAHLDTLPAPVELEMAAARAA